MTPLSPGRRTMRVRKSNKNRIPKTEGRRKDARKPQGPLIIASRMTAEQILKVTTTTVISRDADRDGHERAFNADGRLQVIQKHKYHDRISYTRRDDAINARSSHGTALRCTAVCCGAIRPSMVPRMP